MYTKEQARKKIGELVEDYERKKASGEIDQFYGKGKEENTKDGFIRPLFEYLNWNFRDAKEVSKQETVLKGRVDYGFFINGIPKFFLEAKAIGEPLEISHRKQALEYGINRHVTWVILTNFREILVFNCEWDEQDLEKCQLWQETSIQHFIENFDDLWRLSRDAFLEGSLDKYAENVGKKKTRKPIDEILLDKMLGWRQAISNDIAKNYGSHYSPEDVDEIVQRLLVRLLFIRNCEDRGFEDRLLYPSLTAYKTHKKSIMKNLQKVFTHYDNTYDSKIFEPKEPDKVTISDSVLEKVLHELHFTPDGFEYRFNVIPADIMGRLYEQYLGHILRKTPKHAKLKDGTAHKKEQGIYYTPDYIVDYIVRNTLGELLKQKGVNADKIRILDPACGSGSFLIRAFDYMNEYYSHREEGKQTKLDITGVGITYDKKVEILQNNIFGVDLDPKAVEIAQLNLLLKAAEKKHRLPELQKNVQTGNSLIDDPKVSDRAFKWEEQFKEIMKDGGFDIIIGNPPYVSNWQLSETDRNTVENINSKYSDVASGHWDLYLIFIRKSLSLLKEGGALSFIVPSSFGKEKYGEKLRKLIIEDYLLDLLVDFGTGSIFKDVARQYYIFVIRKKDNRKNVTKILNFKDGTFRHVNSVSQAMFFDMHNTAFRTDLSERDLSILKKMSNGAIKLGSICCINVGVVAHSKEDSKIKFTKDDVITKTYKSGFKRYAQGKEISRYAINWGKTFMDYDSKKDHFHRPKFPELFENRKIIVRRVSGENNSIIALYDEEKFFSNDNLLHLIEWNEKVLKLQSPTKEHPILNPFGQFDLRYLTGILNSRLMTYYFSKKIATGTLQGTYTGVYPEDLRELPIKELSKDNQQKIVDKVIFIQRLNRQLSEIGDKQTDERAKLEEEIKKTDAEIDELVYKLYGITEEEKKIIQNKP